MRMANRGQTPKSAAGAWGPCRAFPVSRKSSVVTGITMTEPEALLIRNLLNRVPVVQAARASDMTEEDAAAAFAECMRRVAEYQLVHCVPFFPVGSVAEAQRHRLEVLEVLGEIQRWDDGDRELALAILAGHNVIAEGADRQHAERVVSRVLNALPYYLPKDNLREYVRDRKSFIRANRGRVRELVEGFVSFRTPLIYKRIIHVTSGNFDELQANLRNF